MQLFQLNHVAEIVRNVMIIIVWVAVVIFKVYLKLFQVLQIFLALLEKPSAWNIVRQEHMVDSEQIKAFHGALRKELGRLERIVQRIIFEANVNVNFFDFRKYLAYSVLIDLVLHSVAEV